MDLDSGHCGCLSALDETPPFACFTTATAKAGPERAWRVSTKSRGVFSFNLLSEPEFRLVSTTLSLKALTLHCTQEASDLAYRHPLFPPQH